MWIIQSLSSILFLLRKYACVNEELRPATHQRMVSFCDIPVIISYVILPSLLFSSEL